MKRNPQLNQNPGGKQRRIEVKHHHSNVMGDQRRPTQRLNGYKNNFSYWPTSVCSSGREQRPHSVQNMPRISDIGLIFSLQTQFNDAVK